MKYVKAITRIILIISVLIIIIWAIVAIPKHQCESLTVTIHTKNESVIVNQHDVEQLLAANKIKIIGKPMKEIDIAAITKMLSANPYIENVNFVHFSNKKLVVDYNLKNIILHVYTTNGDQYFVDEKGALVPYTSKMTDYVAIANGNIRQHYKAGDTARKELRQIVNIFKEINKDEFCRQQFRQAYLNERNQVELVSTLGNQVILFGTDENIEEKLDNLKKVYEEGLTRKGFDTYAQLDVRFKNRVIAQRK